MRRTMINLHGLFAVIRPGLSALVPVGCLLALPPHEVSAAPRDIPENAILIDGDIILSGDSNTAATYTTASEFWPDGIVYFEFDDNVSDSRRTDMLEAMDEWMAVSGVVFLPRFGQADYVHIYHSNANASMVGVQGGQQNIYIVSWDSRFIIAHELCHTLGFWHEQSRTDRDTFVRINWDNIQDNYDHNFFLEDESGTVGPYDFDSLMHYGECAFSTNPVCPLGGGQTITVLPPNEDWQGRIGQTDHFSDRDIEGMRFVYGESEVVFVNHNYTGGGAAGTLARPFPEFPDGADAVPSGGTVWIRGGSYSAIGTYSRRMTLRSYASNVVLGD